MDILISYDHREAEMERIPVRELAEYAIAAEGKPANTEVSIAFVDDEAIADLNERYRGKAGPTDVLSFECDTVADGLPDALLAQDPVFELGDIIIAPDVAEEHAREYGQALADEVKLLVVHGILHLCGYDHEDDAEAQVMEARESELLAGFRKEAGR